MAIVLSSRKAKKHLEKIKAEHAELLKGLQAHQERVTMYRQQKDAESKESSNRDKEFGQKNAEIDIKRAAIASKTS